MSFVTKRRWRDPAGTWREAWQAIWIEAHKRTGKLKRRSKSFPTRAAAKEFLRSLSPTTRGAVVATRHPLGRTYDAIAAAWIAEVKAAGRERSTYDKYQSHHDLHVSRCLVALDGEAPKPFGQYRARELSTPLVHALKTALADPEAGRSIEMVRRLIADVRMALKHGQIAGDLRDNPATPVRVKGAARMRKKVVIPSPAHLRAILEAVATADGEPASFAEAWIHVALKAGLRPSEQRALRWRHLDLDARPAKATIETRADQWNKEDMPKSEAGQREVVLPIRLATLLARWREACPEIARHEVGLVFPTASGHHQSLSNLHARLWLPLLDAVGLTLAPTAKKKDRDGNRRPRAKYILYSLRHAFAAARIEAGTTPKRLQVLMGHSTIKMTLDTYGHLWQDDARDAQLVEAFDRVIEG